MAKVVLVVLDGLNYEVAYCCMGFLHAMCQAKKGKLYKVICELPSTSLPLYECLLTGKAPIESKIVDNALSFSSNQSIFDLSKKAHKKAGAAAYHWVFQLYNRQKFEPSLHRHIEDASLTIPYGHFYYEDHYPDSHLFMDGEHLRRCYGLDFLLIHSMNIDDCGHKFGAASPEYFNAARKADELLACLLLTWLEEGYEVIITADHGMTDHKMHRGITPQEREVPFFVFGEAFSFEECEVLQTQIFAVVSELLGIGDAPFSHRLLK